MAGMQTDRQTSNEATIKTVHRWNALVNMSSRGKALYLSRQNTKACLTVEVCLTVVVYPVYQKTVVVVVVLEMIISTMMAVRTWIISRRKRFRSLTENVAQIQDDPYEQDGFHDGLSCQKNIPYKVFSYLEWMSFEITFIYSCPLKLRHFVVSESEWNGSQRPDLSRPPRRNERKCLNQISQNKCAKTI